MRQKSRIKRRDIKLTIDNKGQREKKESRDSRRAVNQGAGLCRLHQGIRFDG